MLCVAQEGCRRSEDRPEHGARRSCCAQELLRPAGGAAAAGAVVKRRSAPTRTLPLAAPPPCLSLQAHRRSMCRNHALTDPHARSSQATGSGNDRAASRRPRAAVGRWRAISSLAPAATWHATAGRGMAPGPVAGGRRGGRRRLAQRVALRPGRAHTRRPPWPLRLALCLCCRHRP